MTPSLLDQISLATTAAQEISQEKPPANCRPPGSNSRRIFDAMADGQVWHSTRAAETFKISLASARNALRRLCRQEVVAHVGFDYPNDSGHARALFRRRDAEVVK